MKRSATVLENPKNLPPSVCGSFFLFSRAKKIWKLLVPGNRKEVTSCGWREGSTPLSTKEAVIFKRCIKSKQTNKKKL